jgi:hypothetical protein
VTSRIDVLSSPHTSPGIDANDVVCADPRQLHDQLCRPLHERGPEVLALEVDAATHINHNFLYVKIFLNHQKTHLTAAHGSCTVSCADR